MKRLVARLDLGRAVVALVIALLLYAYVHNETNPSEIGSFEVPVDLVDVPSGLLPPGAQTVPSVRVRVSAPRDTLLGIRSTSLRAYVDLRRGTGGVDEYPVGVELPDPRVRLLEVVPAELPVRLEEMSERRVPVRVSRVGSVPFGYEAGQAETEPGEILFSGPSSFIQHVATASVEIKLDGVTLNLDAPYTPIPVDAQGQTVDPGGRALQGRPESVRVRVPITQQLVYKTLPVRPRVIGSINSAYSIEGVAADPPLITLVAPPQALHNVELVETAAVDVTDLATPILTRQVGLNLPEGSSPVGPDSVRITVRLTPLLVLQPFSLPVVAENVPSGLQVTAGLPSVQALLRGPAVAMRTIDPTLLRASVDLAGQDAGVHELPVTVTAPPELDVQSITPSTVTARLTPIQPAQQPTPESVVS